MRRCDSLAAVRTARIVRSHGVRHGVAGDHGMNRRFRPLTWFSFAMLVAFSNDAVALARHKQIQHAGKTDAASRGHHRKAALKKGKHEAVARTQPAPPAEKSPETAAASPMTGEPAAVQKT